jgi:transcriptional regulator with XRE-family HTH domain
MDHSIAYRVASTMRAELARKRVSQEELAVALGISQGAASRRLLGKVEFSLTELEKAAELLAVPVDLLLSIGPEKATA